MVIDEFADLMATSGKELEAIVARLAGHEPGRGYSSVLATQRPSIDVITGLIKANFPSRIAFMVRSKTDSRIIIDMMGAESLQGKGDMLFTSAWDPFPTECRAPFCLKMRWKRVVSYVKTLGEPEYIDDEIFLDEDDYEADNGGGGASSYSDPLYDKALDIVISAGKASASYLQRRLQIGYNRAARLVEEMEVQGIVGLRLDQSPGKWFIFRTARDVKCLIPVRLQSNQVGMTPLPALSAGTDQSSSESSSESSSSSSSPSSS